MSKVDDYVKECKSLLAEAARQDVFIYDYGVDTGWRNWFRVTLRCSAYADEDGKVHGRVSFGYVAILFGAPPSEQAHRDVNAVLKGVRGMVRGLNVG